jgi:hypothetical protein
MCWGIEASDGWYDLLDTLCGSLENHMRNRPKMPPVVVTQVKEKYGGLRFSISGGDEYCDGLVDMAEHMSYKICEACGNPGKPNKGGWISVRCESCRIAEESKRNV